MWVGREFCMEGFIAQPALGIAAANKLYILMIMTAVQILIYWPDKSWKFYFQFIQNDLPVKYLKFTVNLKLFLFSFFFFF